MLVDFEAVLLDLKRAILAKNSHGQRDLLAVISRLEVEHQLDEGTPERALRLYGVVLSDDLLRPALDGLRVDYGDGHDTDPARVPGNERPQEDTNGSQHHGVATVV